MASLKNAIPRRTHKERSQPSHRSKLGLLEKKKDYVERARDYQRKTKRISNLRKKTLDRNPDEFYFGMVNTKTQDGVHIAESKEQKQRKHLEHSHVQKLKNQDLSYLTMRKAMDTKKAEKLQSNLHFLLEKPVNKHTVFLESSEDVDSFDAAEHFDTDPRLVSRAFNRPRKDQLEGADGHEATIIHGPKSAREYKRLVKQRNRSYNELTERLQRAEKLSVEIQKREAEKVAMGKGRKRKVSDAKGGKAAVYKFQRKRAK